MEIVPVTLMGLVAPVTLVGAAVFHTVDVLAGVVMAQLLRPGAPVLFGGAPAAFHMGETTSPMTAVEAMRLDLAYAAIGKHLGLPTQTYLGMSENRALDAQAGAESFGGAVLAALAGINSVSGAGNAGLHLGLQPGQAGAGQRAVRAGVATRARHRTGGRPAHRRSGAGAAGGG